MTKEEFKALRKSLRLSQIALAVMLGVSFATVNRWETGKFKINHHAAEIFRQKAKELVK